MTQTQTTQEIKCALCKRMFKEDEMDGSYCTRCQDIAFEVQMDMANERGEMEVENEAY